MEDRMRRPLFLLNVLVLTVIVSWVACTHLHALYINQRTFEEVENIGGKIEWEETAPFARDLFFRQRVPQCFRTPKRIQMQSKNLVTDNLWHILHNHSAEELDLRFSKFHPVLIDTLSRNMPALRKLDFLHTAVSDSEVAMLSRLGTIESLNLSFTKVTDRGLRYISTMTSLKSLSLRGCSVHSAGVQHLERLPNLEELDLAATRVDDAVGASIAQIQSLKCLDVEDTYIGDEAVGHLCRLRNLKQLYIGGTNITDECRIHLQKMDALESLSVSYTSVGDRMIKDIASLKRLQIIDVDGTNVTDVGVRKLLANLSLKHISMNDTVMSRRSDNPLELLFIDRSGPNLSWDQIVRRKQRSKGP